MTSPTHASPTPPDASKQAVLKDIHAKWDKFSETDLSALKGRDDLVMQVIAKYGQEKSVAQRDVDALLKGRTI
jgi:hypothetical protein